MVTSHSISVPFHGNTLFIASHNDEPYVPMKPVVEGIGLDWKAQFSKLKQRFGATMVEITMVAGDGKKRLMSCLALRKLPGWLMTIHANKVRPELRGKVLQYQEECDDVLWRYWSDNFTTRPDTTLSPAQQRQIQRLVADKVDASGVGRKGFPMIYRAIKNRFSVASYSQVPAEQHAELLRFLDGVVLEGEFIPRRQLPTNDTANTGSVILNEYEAANLYNLLGALNGHKKTLKKVEAALREIGSFMAPDVHAAWAVPHSLGHWLEGARQRCEPAHHRLLSK